MKKSRTIRSTIRQAISASSWLHLNFSSITHRVLLTTSPVSSPVSLPVQSSQLTVSSAASSIHSAYQSVPQQVHQPTSRLPQSSNWIRRNSADSQWTRVLDFNLIRRNVGHFENSFRIKKHSPRGPRSSGYGKKQLIREVTAGPKELPNWPSSRIVEWKSIPIE